MTTAIILLIIAIIVMASLVLKPETEGEREVREILEAVNQYEERLKFNHDNDDEIAKKLSNS